MHCYCYAQAPVQQVRSAGMPQLGPRLSLTLKGSVGLSSHLKALQKNPLPSSLSLLVGFSPL